jgi:catechol 2,3-dioxygenase-like lactoylglutathione lyase family enzyme
MSITLSHRGMCVGDCDRSLAFYRDALGFGHVATFAMDDPALATVMEVPGAKIRAHMVRNAEGVTLELLQFVEPAPFGSRERRPNNQYGLTHLAFYVDDMDRAADRIRAAGGRVYEQTRALFPEGSTTMMYCTDPDGVRIELMHNPAIAPRFSHSGICVTDIGASQAFYAGGIGFAPAETYALDNHSSWLDIVNELPGVRLRAQMMRSPEGHTFELLKIHAPDCFGPRTRRTMNQFGLTHMAFYVDDIDSVAADIVAAGGTAWPQTRAVFATGIEIMYCTDPDGVRVELMRAA